LGVISRVNEVNRIITTKKLTASEIEKLNKADVEIIIA
jgi:DeoR/GlpR family transcriptional regulator of sugar metabolism